MAAPGRGGVKWIFQTPHPSPTLHLLIQSPPLSQSRPGSAKCDLAPLIAGGGCGAGASREAGGREDPPPQAPPSLRARPMRVERARPCPTHTHTHTHTQTRTRWWGPRGFLSTLLAPGNTLGPRDPLCWCPQQACPHPQAVLSQSPPSRLPSVGAPLPVTRPRPPRPAPGCNPPPQWGIRGRPGSVCTSLLPSGGSCCFPAPAQGPSPVGWDQSPKQLLLQPGLLVWKWAHLLPRGPVGQIDPSSRGRLGHPAD